jgi:uncharacterized protein (TIGR00159 family)
MPMLAKIDLFNNLEIFIKNFSLSGRDFLDVLVIAFLIYLVIKLLRETHSISVVIGVLTLLGLYGVALLFDLPLTSLVLQSFFGVFLIIIAIIFQRELRRFFSTFGFLGLARRLTPPPEAIIETVSRSIGHMSREKIGSLIIFPGREPIDRHLEGGYRLNGEISEPLLLSIFDKTSPGHDGATIIENNRIKKFAVHLPLAEHIDGIRHLGLRHRAALGLSERSDSFIIVVSEERGIISVARNGKFVQAEDEENLKLKLIDFYAEKFPRLNLTNFSRWLLKNIFLFAISFLIAFGIFFFINSKFTFVQRNFAVAPEFTNIPSEILIKDVVPQEVVLTLEGRGSDFEVFKPSDLRMLIDVGSIPNVLKPGTHRLVIDAKNISLPFKLKLIKIEPLSIRLQTEAGSKK